MAESMKDFETELEQSFQVIKEGDVLEVEVIGISETELTVDLNYYTEGIIPLEECSDDPAFSIKIVQYFRLRSPIRHPVELLDM